MLKSIFIFKKTLIILSIYLLIKQNLFKIFNSLKIKHYFFNVEINLFQLKFLKILLVFK